jgi:protein-tyrosine phosphatase
MARALVDDGVTVAACTPHITPGIYHNTGGAIIAAVEQLQSALDDHAIPLFLVSGADNHMVPDFVGALRSGHLLPLHGSRYVLVEPPHRSAPPRLEEFFLDLIAHGYVPILTHPERLSWIQDKYDLVGDLVNAGVWMQLTSGSLTGAFGSSAHLGRSGCSMKGWSTS